MSNEVNTQVVQMRQVPVVSNPAAARKSEVDGSAEVAGGRTLPPGGQSRPAMAEAVAAEDVNGAVRRLNDYAQQMNRELRFSIDEDSGRTVIRVIDPDSEEVIRQIPPEEILSLARYMLTEGEGPGRLLKVIA
ncbi:flagellar protein FlaG [Thiohalobacter sp. IOR34]|uniref:flagellar protein FlaG n=1 Tax=Thiohalobacter sp. IOR34 TaxID=3057176 RepID=UPI0025B2717D|nr:flagellar protein FlaG [Thiohalobacter sp. IOR34]WJW74583.1 flagellar protein FlaG [Thiohalobacter sp. IOR34]